MRGAETAARVLLISAPWRTPNVASLGLATLRGTLERASIATDELHGTLLFDPGSSNEFLRLQYSAFYFIGDLDPTSTPEEVADVVLETYLGDYSMLGVRTLGAAPTFAALGLDEEELRRAILADIERAARCVDRCVAHVLAGPYDVIGFSCTFEPQLPAALAIARRVRAARPGIRIVMGGAACHGEPAEELLTWEPALDAVCYGEGDRVIAPLVQALRDGTPLAEVGGIAFVDDNGQLQRTPAPPLVADLDELPIPVFDDFVRQLATSPWGATLAPKLYFETSRGCWWGQKHLCTFCGLNADSLAYRRKSPDRAVEEIRHLYESYPQAERLYGTDNILDMDYFRSVLPRLAPLAQHRHRPLRLFFELKSNLKKHQVQQLAEAGVDHVQPGIESLADDVLTLMKKGATGLGQVQHLKWLTEYGIGIVYNLIVLNPGESTADYIRMAAMIPYVDHLPPPSITHMWLERFSPYFVDPERYGIQQVRARPYYRTLCKAEGVDLDRLAYVFDYDHPTLSDPAHRAAVAELVRNVDAWSERWEPDTVFYLPAPDHVAIVDRRKQVRAWLAAGTARELFDHLDAPHTCTSIARRFDHLDAQVLDATLSVWRFRRWVCRDPRDRYLCVIPKRAQ